MYILAKWCDSWAWQFKISYEILQTYNSSVIAAFFHVLTIPIVLLFYFQYKDIYEPIDFKMLLEDEEYKISLQQGTIFHYINFSTRYSVWLLLYQNNVDLALITTGIVLPATIILQAFFLATASILVGTSNVLQNLSGIELEDEYYDKLTVGIRSLFDKL